MKHGHSTTKSGKSPTYVSWQKMKERCTNPNHIRYRHYGGRGIGICKQWLENFLTFLNDMGERPAGMTLDRIDINRGYEPSNCRWATVSEQNANRKPWLRKKAV